MFKLTIGCFVSAVAMFLVGFLYFAGPLSTLAFARASEVQTASIQTALAQNLEKTGTYVIPDPSTQSGTTLYGKGPVAMVHYNSRGFPVESLDGMAWGFALYLAAAALMATALLQLADFRSRAVALVCFSTAVSALAILTDPIFQHQDWTYAIFSLVGSVFVLLAGGLVLARWFMPSASNQA